ncbi:hypothetical protein [Kitasatospora sp. NPDC097691]|uniref:hypothetical protein n=1 Tax=Kitasatospora sp. NPDC097691 TaxID=3157231 RepID=UPI00331BC7FA
MTVLHSRNADAADPADVADAADVKDPQDAAAEPDLREDLGRYAELGAFTLTADTHAWYAALDTVATPEDARAASTALAELRGRDLQQTWEAVTALATEVKLDEPDTVAKTALLVEMLQRVHRTSATLTTAAYDADLGALAAATADSAWRRENGVKLSWLRGRSLRKQATALATDRRVRREDLHEALTSAEIERRAWAALAPAGSLPAAPADGALVDRTAQAFEAINTGLRELARVLPDHDLDGLPFAELIDLVERLAADEGTLYRLPTIRGLRAGLEEAGLGELLTELAAAKADRRAAEAAYSARQALAGGQRDGLAEEAAAEETTVEKPVADAEARVEADAEAAAEADAEALARQALAGGQRDGLVEEVPAPVTAPAEEAVEAAAAVELEAELEAEIEDLTETETEAEVEAEAEAEAVSGSDSDTDAADVETVAVVSLPAPSPAADDLVAAATAALAEVVAVEETAAEEAESAIEVEESAAEAEAEAEADTEAEADVTGTEVVTEEPVAEVETAGTEVEVEVKAETVVVEESAEAETLVAEPEVEAVVEEPAAEVAVAADDVAEAEPVAEAVAEEPAAEVEVSDAEPEAVVEESAGEVVEAEAPVAEPQVEAEPEPQALAVEAEAPVAEVEPVAEVVAEESVVEPEAVAEEPAAEVVIEEPATEAQTSESEPAAGRVKPDFTPGRPVTAYSADELLAVVRWLDGDGVERSDEELLRAAMKELGFARLGPRIKEALGAAVTAARG